MRARAEAAAEAAEGGASGGESPPEAKAHWLSISRTYDQLPEKSEQARISLDPGE